MMDRDARWDKTVPLRHRKVEMQKLGESGGSFNTQIGGGGGQVWKGGAEEGGGGRGNSEEPGLN